MADIKTPELPLEPFPGKDNKKPFEKIREIIGNDSEKIIKEEIKINLRDFAKGEFLIRLKKPTRFEAEAPLGAPLRVRFEAHQEPAFPGSIAAYIAATHVVEVYPLITYEVADESIKLTLAHEKTHSIFQGLQEQNQSNVVDIFLRHRKPLEEAYKALRNFSYGSKYFHLPYAWILEGKRLNRGYKIQKPAVFEKEFPDAAIVTDEVLAWMRQRTSLSSSPDKSAEEKLLGVVLEGLFQSFSSEEKQLLGELGLLDADASDLFSELQQNAEFVSYRREVKEIKREMEAIGKKAGEIQEYKLSQRVKVVGGLK